MCTFATRVCSYIWDVMDDLSAIPQENIIDYLLERFERGQIYTWVGTLLLAINPDGETTTEDIYDLSRANDLNNNVSDVALKDVAPHIFAVAARAHYRVVQGLGKPSQVIVLNGETGTGKTFNAWRALEFLTAGNASADKRRGQDAACRDLGQRIADACRLISAFTVASTEGNEISSRHVELVWLEYKLGSVCGAMVSSYLLERNRVTMGRCNFQIFGQMMTALTDIEFADTGLSRDARYFMSSDLDPSKGQQLRDGFRDTMRAMDMLGFTEDRKKDIFQVLALLIHMSNIRFTQEDDHCRIDTDDQQSKEALENTCKLARLQKEDIVELLTSTLINPQSSWRRHPVCRRNLNTEDACRYRLHSIIRHLYDLLFHWLINSVNGILSARLFSERLGILDIFGFERFDANGIEQLCVNYVNERLQRYFMEKYLEFRRKNLQEEGLIEDAEPPDIVRLYEDRLSTIEKRLFATLNDVCLSTVPSDSATLIRQVCANGCPETRRFLKVRQENFVVQHYAGAVEYSVNDLLSKNIDKIPDEITVTFAVSKNTFLYRLINKSKLHHENGKAKKATMLSKLRCNVDSLTRELNNCDAHYVRCIKPRRLNNREWDRNELRRQLANTGILDALPLARCKYPIHFTYKEFFKRYRCEQTSDFRAACKMLESRLTMNDDDSLIHYGKHFIFLTERTFLQLESARKQLHVECVEKIESFWIKYRNYRRQHIKGNMADAQTINIQNELIEKSPPERKRIISMGICVYAETYRRQSTRENTARDGQAVVNIDIRDESTKTNLLENKYDVQLIDYSNIQGKPQFTPPNVLSLVPKKSLISHNQLADIRSQDARCTCNSSSNRFHTESGLEKNSEDYNKGEDVHVIRHGTSTLFYKNGVLSRRRPARLPVRVHTRLTCLTNSHYLVHTELPQGLQDCL
ncbi:unnamed protein product [Lasius platythorax]|uniref:Myosin motor domain-containing protein n=1 Tax=Lasius platythorax TaxID=488582 RepID=A0AAV2NG99_9HYME